MVQELKKKLLVQENTINSLKTEQHRLELDSLKQQRRIDQLLHLSEGAKGSAENVRKDIEKSVLVRQIKAQVTALRSLIADKDFEISSLRQDVRASYVKVIEIESKFGDHSMGLDAGN